jgi:hypothetical protein
MDFLIIGLFGFPGALLSLIVSVIGILKGKYGLLILGMFLFLPFCLYLDGTPNFKGTTMLGLFHLAAAYAVRRNANWLAWILLLPSVVLTIFVLNLSLTSPR